MRKTGFDAAEKIISAKIRARIPFGLKNLYLDGEFSRIAEISGLAAAPSFLLAQNSPNPFYSSTGICYTLDTSQQATLQISDIMGRHIATLVNSFQAAGCYAVQWNGEKSSGGKAAAGIYFYRLTGNGAVITRRMIILP